MRVRLHLRLPKIPLFDPKQVEAIIFKEVFIALNTTMESLATDVKLDTPVDTGVLRASIFGRIWREPGNRFMGEVASGKQVPYAIFVEEDTKPHFPPVAALEGWARRHNVSAFLVARAISRRGTKGRHMFAKNLAKWRLRFQPALDSAVNRIARLLQGL